jgi:hypothetical protein
MSLKSQLFLGIEIALAACFGLAAVKGGVSLVPAGVSIQKLAYDWIGGLVLFVAVASCLISSLSLAEFIRFRRKADARIFLFAFTIAILSISPYANAPDTFGIKNVRSIAMLTYPIFLWLACLIVILVHSYAHPASKES